MDQQLASETTFPFHYRLGAEQVVPRSPEEFSGRQQGFQRIEGLVDKVLFIVERAKHRQIAFDVKEGDVLGGDSEIFVVLKNEETILSLWGSQLLQKVSKLFGFLALCFIPEDIAEIFYFIKGCGQGCFGERLEDIVDAVSFKAFDSVFVIGCTED